MEQSRKRRSRSRSPRPRSHSHSRSRSRSRSRSGSPRGKRYERDPAREEQRRLAKEAKARMKELETPEEKRARRLAKKQAKDGKRQEGQHRASVEPVMGQKSNEEISAEMFDDRPDESKFVWHKKYQDLESKGVSRDEVRRQEASMRKENEAELEKVRRAREQRELERAMFRQDKDQQMRGGDDALFSKWVSNEDKFHFEQAKRRSEIRVREGRGKPIDQLSIYVYGTSEPIAQTVQLPFAVFAHLSVRELEELIEEMRSFQRLEQSPSAEEFWKDMLTIAEHEHKEKRAEAVRTDPTISAAERRALESGINEQVKESVMNILRGKSIGELDSLEVEIRKRMSSGNAFDDTTFWNALLDELHPQRARARLRAAHPARVQAALTGLPRDGSDSATAPHPAAAAATAAAAAASAVPPPSAAATRSTAESDTGLGGAHHAITAAGVAAEAEDAREGMASGSLYDATPDVLPPPATHSSDPRDRSFSPEPVPLSSVPADAVVVEVADDEHMLRLARDDVRNRLRSGRLTVLPPPAAATATGAGAAESDEESGAGAGGSRASAPTVGKMVRTGAALDDSERATIMYKAEEQRGENENEEPFNEDYGLGNVTYRWASKYTPIKPRFFNRVMSGFEWNQYNRTHYDVENLPPKIVQGYKFNIFYPELINREQTPTFTVRPLPEDPEYAILRFSAGPPYEDVAFKVMNVPWLYSRRAGYRCQFDRTNCFQLYFFYRRERYRR